MTRCGNDSKAWHYYNLALQCSPVKAAELKRECYEALSDICFKRGDFSQCIEYGIKGYTVKADKNEVRIHFVRASDISRKKSKISRDFQRQIRGKIGRFHGRKVKIRQ